MSEVAPPQSRRPEQVGNEPFVFICYSHKDTERVDPHIEYLRQQAVGLWFDGGIRAGAIWRREVTQALDRATHLVFFVSRASLDSDHCDREVQYALDQKKPVLPVFLEGVEFTPELRVALGRVHALYAYKMSREALQGALRHAIRGGDGAALPRAGPQAARPRRQIWISVAIVVLLGTAAGVWRSGMLTSWHIEAQAQSPGIVVLPFENGSGSPEYAYLSEGFADELRDQLSRVPGLRVVARPSSILYRDLKKPASEIARELGVTTIVEGSLRKEGDRVRVAVRLIDGADDSQLWSESYDRKAIDLLAVQQEVALAAARQISPKINAAQLPKPQWQASVHDLMLLARSYQQKAVTPADWDKAVSLYQQVVQADPESALAHARLAKSLLFQGKDLEGGEAHARRALELEPNLAEGHAVLGFIVWTQFRHGAGQAYARAIELNPNDVETLLNYGMYLGIRHHDASDNQRALEYLRRARELDPMSLHTNGIMARHEAIDQAPEYAQDMALIQERFPDAAGRFALARISATAGDLDEAIAWQMEVRRLDPENEEANRDIAQWLARLGLGAESRKVEPEPSLRTLFWERRYDEIITRMANADLDQADGDSLSMLALALQAVGRDSEAVPVLEALGLPQMALDDDLRREASIHYLAVLIGSLHRLDDPRAEELALWLAQWHRRGGEDKGWGRWWSACALSVLGKRDEALGEFEAATTAGSLAHLPYLRDAACLRDLQQEPRYEKAIQVLQGRHDAIRDRLPATLAKHGFTMEQI